MSALPLTVRQRFCLLLLGAGLLAALFDWATRVQGETLWLGCAGTCLVLAGGRERFRNGHHLLLIALVIAGLFWLVASAGEQRTGVALTGFVIVAAVATLAHAARSFRQTNAIAENPPVLEPVLETNLPSADSVSVDPVLPLLSSAEQRSLLLLEEHEEEEFEDEEEAAADWRAPDETVTQSWTRVRCADEERIEVSLVVSFEPGQQQAYVHLPFSPSLSAPPQGWCLVDEQSVSAEFDLLQTFGTRVTVRRRGDRREARSVPIQVVLAAPLRKARAA